MLCVTKEIEAEREMCGGRKSVWSYKPKNTDSKTREQSKVCGKENEILGLKRGLSHQEQTPSAGQLTTSCNSSSRVPGALF